jgi:hypothetical protein
MTIDTNNIAALRTALEKMDELEAAIDEVSLQDDTRARIESSFYAIKRRLVTELKEAEERLLPVLPNEYVGRSLYS